MAVSFSIIVPVYNKSKYLRLCIDSLLAQKHQDFEIIAIDDGSSDDSLSILRSYNDERLLVYSIPNGGVSNARNKGIAHAGKEYVTFVDGDDTVADDYLIKFENEIAKYDPDVIIGGLIKIYPNGKVNNVCPSLPHGVIPWPDFKKQYVVQMFDNYGILGYVAAKFVKREFLAKNGVRFNTSLKLAEDLDFWAKVYVKANTIAITDYAGYLYTQETDNSTFNMINQHLSQIEIWLDILRDYTTVGDANRSLVLHKINSIFEAQMLELSDCGFETVKNSMSRLFGQTNSINKDLQSTTSGVLQRFIASQNVLAVWLYLIIRNMYHKFRQ